MNLRHLFGVIFMLGRWKSLWGQLRLSKQFSNELCLLILFHIWSLGISLGAIIMFNQVFNQLIISEINVDPAQISVPFVLMLGKLFYCSDPNCEFTTIFDTIAMKQVMCLWIWQNCIRSYFWMTKRIQAHKSHVSLLCTSNYCHLKIKIQSESLNYYS